MRWQNQHGKFATPRDRDHEYESTFQRSWDSCAPFEGVKNWPFDGFVNACCGWELNESDHDAHQNAQAVLQAWHHGVVGLKRVDRDLRNLLPYFGIAFSIGKYNPDFLDDEDATPDDFVSEMQCKLLDMGETELQEQEKRRYPKQPKVEIDPNEKEDDLPYQDEEEDEEERDGCENAENFEEDEDAHAAKVKEGEQKDKNRKFYPEKTDPVSVQELNAAAVDYFSDLLGMKRHISPVMKKSVNFLEDDKRKHFLDRLAHYTARHYLNTCKRLVRGPECAIEPQDLLQDFQTQLTQAMPTPEELLWPENQPADTVKKYQHEGAIESWCGVVWKNHRSTWQQEHYAERNATDRLNLDDNFDEDVKEPGITASQLYGGGANLTEGHEDLAHRMNQVRGQFDSDSNQLLDFVQDGMTQQDAAKELGISVRTVGRRIAKARQLFKKTVRRERPRSKEAA